MSHLTLSLGNATLADRLLGRGLGIDAALIVTGVALTAIAAQVTVPIWPVPITGQTVAVLLVGMSLGSLRGALSMLVYALCGAFGLPIFSDGSSGFDSITGPTGGYILGFIGAAAFVGWLAQRGLDRSILRSIGSAAGGTAIIYLIGLPWLATVQSLTLEQTLAAGLLPLILGGIIKLLTVAILNTAAWSAILRLDEREQRRVRGDF